MARVEEGGTTLESDPINDKFFITRLTRAGSKAHVGPEAGGDDGRVCGAWAVFVACGTMSAAGFKAAYTCAARLYSCHLGR